MILLKIKDWIAFFILMLPIVVSFFIDYDSQFLLNILTFCFMFFYIIWIYCFYKATNFIKSDKNRLFLYLLCVLIFLCLLNFYFTINNKNETQGLISIYFFISFATMFTYFYFIYIVSQKLCLLEKSLLINKYDLMYTLIMFWFFPFGLWILHKRLRQLVLTLESKQDMI